MSATSQTATTTQVYRVYIKATPQAIWDAITLPEWQVKYGYQAPADYDLRPGGAYRGLATPAMKEFGAPDVLIDGEVLECDPPQRLVQTWRALFYEGTAAEGPTRLTWEITDNGGGMCTLTVTHELENAPATAAIVSSHFSTEGGGGWAWILSDLKTLLETGSAIYG
jgi:uncharacterized protein YndB with AHSA1/START domain